MSGFKCFFFIIYFVLYLEKMFLVVLNLGYVLCTNFFLNRAIIKTRRYQVPLASYGVLSRNMPHSRFC
jgi:hypothetical protein